MTETALDLVVPVEAADERLDRWLHERVPGVSRSHLARLLAAGAIRLNGAVARPGARLRGGDRITGTVASPPDRATPPAPEPIPLPIVYQDDDVLVVDKPAGLVVHPAPGHPTGTLVNAVVGLWTDDDSGEANPRPGIVHRLDRDTSGLLVVARHSAALADLQRQLAARTVLKQYLAAVRGTPSSEKGTIEAPIGRDPRFRQRMAVVATGRPAVTHFRVLEHGRGWSQLEVTLETGRTHQIRVHLAAIGHPVLGDPLYGTTEPKLGLTRQFLHACRLEFDHPRTGDRRRFESPLPSDLQSTLVRLRDREAGRP